MFVEGNSFFRFFVDNYFLGNNSDVFRYEVLYQGCLCLDGKVRTRPFPFPLTPTQTELFSDDLRGVNQEGLAIFKFLIGIGRSLLII